MRDAGPRLQLGEVYHTNASGILSHEPSSPASSVRLGARRDGFLLTEEQTLSLIPLSQATRMLAEMRSLDEVRKLRDLAESARVYAKAHHLGIEAQNHAGVIAVEAGIRQGEILKQMLPAGERSYGGRPRKTNTEMEFVSKPTLADLNTTTRESANAQALAAEETAVREWMATAKEVTPRRAARVAQKARHQKAARNAPPLPTGVYNVILADPPWEYDNSGGLPGQASNHYGTMTQEEIANLRLPSADNAVLFLWVTNPFLAEGLELARQWGFEYKTNVVWVKRNLKKPGIGFYVRGHHELLFVCTRGAMLPDQEGRTPIGSVIEADIREHSRKPEETYDLIEALYPGGSYLELFARGNRPGWTAWGTDSSLLLAASPPNH